MITHRAVRTWIVARMRRKGLVAVPDLRQQAVDHFGGDPAVTISLFDEQVFDLYRGKSTTHVLVGDELVSRSELHDHIRPAIEAHPVFGKLGKKG